MVMHSVVSYYHVMGSGVGVKPIHKVVVHMVVLKKQVPDPDRIKTKAIVVYFIVLDYACTSVTIVAYARAAATTFVSQIRQFRIGNVCGTCGLLFHYNVWPWYSINACMLMFSVWQYIKLKFSVIIR